MSTDEKIDISEIFKNALNDPELFSTLDIDNLLTSFENEKSDYLENKTIKSVAEEIYEKINEFDIPKETKLSYCSKLNEYRFVNNIHELHKGKYVRYIRLPQNNIKEKIDFFDDTDDDSDEESNEIIEQNKNTGKLMQGGIVINIQFTNYGIYITLLSKPSFYFRLRYDNFYFFQKLTMNEQLILMLWGTYGATDPTVPPVEPNPPEPRSVLESSDASLTT